MKKLSPAINKKITELAPRLPVVAELQPGPKLGKEDQDTELRYIFEKRVKSGEDWLKENPQLRQTDGEPLDPHQRYVFRFMKPVNHLKVLRKECLKLATEAAQINFINQYTLDIISIAETQPEYIPEMLL